MEDQQKLNGLLLKRAQLLSQLEMLSSASDEFYAKLGRVEADIHLLKRKMLRENQNITENEN
jgi:molecular chaperone GrpE (heat shock protein)